MTRTEKRKEMKTLSLYHKNKTLSSAVVEFLSLPYSMTAIITAYTSFACAWTGTPLPHWYGAGVWITAGVPIAALITFAVSEAVRIARRANTPTRMGIVPPDEICRILRGDRKGNESK